jgi:hypothetical protein
LLEQLLVLIYTITTFCSSLDAMSMLKPSKEDGILACNKIDKLLVRPSGYEWQEGGGRKGCSDGDGDGIDGGNHVDLTAVEDLYRSFALGNLAQDIAYRRRNIPVRCLGRDVFWWWFTNCIRC